MFKIMLLLHLLTAIFAIGPLVGAATTAARGLREGDAAATRASARALTIYSYASVAVIVFGFGLLSSKTPRGKAPGDFGDLWVWLSLVLWLVALAVTLGVVVPALKKATAAIGAPENLDPLTVRVGAGGGVVALLFLLIVVLMVYQPGS